MFDQVRSILTGLALSIGIAAFGISAAMEAKAELVGHGGPVRDIAISPDGGGVLSAGFDYRVILWDTKQELARRVFFGHDAAVNAVAFAPDGRHAVSAGADGKVILWKVAGRDPVRVFQGHVGKVASVAVSLDGRLAASGGFDGTVRVWDLFEETGEPLIYKGHTGPVNGIAFLPDGRRLATGGYDGTVRLWSLDDVTGGRETFANLGFSVNFVVVTADGNSLVTAGTDEAVRVFDLISGFETKILLGHRAPVLAIAVSPDGRRFATGGARGQVILWSFASTKPVWEAVRHKGPVWSLAFAPDSSRLMSAGIDGRIKTWRADDGRELGARIAAVASRPEEEGLEGELKRGAVLFRKCRACHSLAANDQNRAGPTLYGVIGRRVGTAPGYPYSPALRKSSIIWSPSEISRLFDEGPDVVTPGTKMPLQRLTNAEDRAALVAYIEYATREFATRPAGAPLVKKEKKQ